MPTPNISKFIAYCETELDLQNRLIVNKEKDPNETFYKSLPVCIIDAVFSIGVKYQNVENAEKAFFKYFNLNISREYSDKNEYTIEDFIKNMETFSSFEEAAKKGFKNSQRTSSTNGILKAEASYLVAKVFQKHKINTLEDFRKYKNKDSLDNEIKQVKGQSSGIMLKYLYMLAGKSDEIKPDRHMVNFMKTLFPHMRDKKDYPEIIEIIKETIKHLKPQYPMLTERFLDVLIWEYMRSPKVWLLSVQTSLPNICTSFQDLATTCEVYESFEDAKTAFLSKIQHYAFSSNLIFDENGEIKNLNAYTKEADEIFGNENTNDNTILTPSILRDIAKTLCLAFNGETVSLKTPNGRYDDGIIGVDITSDEINFVGYDTFNGYDPILHTNILDMSSEKHYFLHINPLFGYGTDDGTAELYIDLRKATVYPEKHISKD